MKPSSRPLYCEVLFLMEDSTCEVYMAWANDLLFFLKNALINEVLEYGLSFFQIYFYLLVYILIIFK